MLKLKKGRILKALFAIGLLIAFIELSAIPSIKNFMSEKVVTEETENKTGELQSPAITLCAEIVRPDSLVSYSIRSSPGTAFDIIMIIFWTWDFLSIFFCRKVLGVIFLHLHTQRSNLGLGFS